MAINFSGDFTTARSLDEVYGFLSDPNQFGPLLPDFQSMAVQDATHFTVKVRVGVGNIRGTAELKMELAEAVWPHRAQYTGQGTAVGSQITVTAGFDLSPATNGWQGSPAVGTRVAWQGEATVFGKLASMAGGMLEPLGRKNIQKLIDGLQKALSEPAASTTLEAPELSQVETAPPNEAGASTPVPPQSETSIALGELTTIEVPVSAPSDTAALPGDMSFHSVSEGPTSSVSSSEEDHGHS